jgi:MOSC domain-containing protein YiiM
MLRDLVRRFPRAGRLEAIYLRPARDVSAIRVASAIAIEGRGLDGDRSATGARNGHKRQVTLFQHEHVPLIAAWMGRDDASAALFRRNLVVSGVNLLSARELFDNVPVRIRIGREVVLAVTGSCDPCSKMEAALGEGGYNAMRGHGGLTARIEAGGTIAAGDQVLCFVANSR